MAHIFEVQVTFNPIRSHQEVHFGTYHSLNRAALRSCLRDKKLSDTVELPQTKCWGQKQNMLLALNSPDRTHVLVTIWQMLLILER